MVRSVATAAALFGAAAYAAAAAAPSPTISVLLPGFDNQSLVGSIVGVKGDQTTLVVDCGTGVATQSSDDSDCGLEQPMTVTQGPSSIFYELGVAASATTSLASIGVACEILSNKDNAVCTYSVPAAFVSQERAIQSAMSTTDSDGDSILTNGEVESFTGLASQYIAVTITAGADKLTNPAPGATTTAGASATGTAAATTSGASTASATGKAAATSTHKAAAALPQVTRHAVLAGVAAAIGGALVL